MNAYQKALEKTAKREERKARQVLTLPAIVTPAPKPVEAPKAKNGSDAYIEVKVTLPTGVIEFTLTKDSVMSNVPQNKLSRILIENGVRNGLASIFGALK